MFDIFNHLAVFIVIFGLSFTEGLINHEDAKELFTSSVFCAVVVMVPAEILAWSIWYLAGGA